MTASLSGVLSAERPHLRQLSDDATGERADGNPAMKVLDLFSGAAGGWSLGLHRAGFKTIAACEADPWRRAVFAHNNPGVRMYDDVRTLTGDRLRADGLVPDIIVGSPPCQDASTANAKGKGIDGERTGLFLDYIRIVGEIRPRWAAAENVPGLRARGADRVLAEMEALGYAGWPLVVGAVHAGANHLRKRAWFLWLRNDVADAARLGCGEGWAWRLDPSGTRESEQAFHHADAASVLGLAIEGRQPDGIGAGIAAYSREDAIRLEPQWTGREGGASASEFGAAFAHSPGDQGEPRRVRLDECERGVAREIGAPRLGQILAQSRWNGGAPDLGRVDDGVSAALASRRGIGRACLAGFGDAVLPQITEAIGRTILTVDALISTQIIGNASPLGISPDDGPEGAVLAPPGFVSNLFCSQDHGASSSSLLSRSPL